MILLRRSIAPATPPRSSRGALSSCLSVFTATIFIFCRFGRRAVDKRVRGSLGQLTLRVWTLQSMGRSSLFEIWVIFVTAKQPLHFSFAAGDLFGLRSTSHKTAIGRTRRRRRLLHRASTYRTRAGGRGRETLNGLARTNSFNPSGNWQAKFPSTFGHSHPSSARCGPPRRTHKRDISRRLPWPCCR